ncbi:hypothetical protein [Streptomyces albicerus]|uniref:hypothetical protein n=1 Tax=Streptomyces albicerus TaxID=2569859 RepID=UPI00124B16AB|nr:hypothetical protein [Streptomyces albicerus]
MQDIILAAVDLGVTVGALAAGLFTHLRWLGASAGLWLVLGLRQGWLALRVRRCAVRREMNRTPHG